jgi:hypothetical protein
VNNNTQQRHLVEAWMMLVVLTSISFFAFRRDAAALPAISHWSATGLMLLVYVKMRLISLHFMELKRAPTYLRAMMEVWIVVAIAALLSMYYGFVTI